MVNFAAALAIIGVFAAAGWRRFTRSEDTMKQQPVVIPQVHQALSRPEIREAFIDAVWPALPPDLTTAERAVLAFDTWERFIAALPMAGETRLGRELVIPICSTCGSQFDHEIGCPELDVPR